jgi:two-component system chemotaxis response regulator CheB
MAPYRILVVDDSAFMRKIISDLIVQDPQFTIVATAGNGKEAVEAVAEWKPDAVTLDLEMPLMNGIEALQLIMKSNPIPVIMLSGISEDNTRETIKALQFGAFDFIRKPSTAVSNDIHHVGESLLEKLRIAVLTKRHQPVITIKEAEAATAAAIKQLRQSDMEEPQKHEDKSFAARPAKAKERRKTILPLAKDKQPMQQMTPPLHTKPIGYESEPEAPSSSKPAFSTLKPVTRDIPRVQARQAAVPLSARSQNAKEPAASFRHLVAIGTSTGGPRALHQVISSLPADFPAPVLVVQHMPPKFTKSLAQRLDSFSALRVVEAERGEKVSAGVVYIAPGGYHMELAKDASGYIISLTEQPQRNGHRPSVDVLFESLIPFREFKRHAVIMTGMGSDGARGMQQLADSGIESTIAESEETCVVYGMPRSAIEMGYVDTVLPLQLIASQLVQAVLK